MDKQEQTPDPARVEAEMDRVADRLRHEGARVVTRLRAQVQQVKAALDTGAV